MYHTECMEVAIEYSERKGEFIEGKQFVFVNEIISSAESYVTKEFSHYREREEVKTNSRILFSSTHMSIVLRQLQKTTNEMNEEENTEELQSASGASVMSLLQIQV